MPLAVGQILQNRYRIEALLGQGGFGAVYRAVDLNIKFLVAVKENLDASPEASRQFAREASMLVCLRHPSLPRVMDTFFIPGQGQYLVMDYVDGQDLQEMLDQHGPLDEAWAVAWMGQVLDALAYLHAQNPPIVHRDVKPANIRITPDGRAVLVDFGIAKLYDPRLLTTTGARAVTAGYSPWEQYGQGGTDARSDVYAAGATLYALLTGAPPPESIALVGGMARLLPPRSVNSRLSPQVEAVVLQAMATQPTGRFGDGGQMRAALLSAPPPAPVSVRSAQPLSRSSVRQPKPRSPQPPWALWAGIGIVLAATVMLLVLLISSLDQPASRFTLVTVTRRPPVQTWTVMPAQTGQPAATVPAGQWAAINPPDGRQYDDPATAPLTLQWRGPGLRDGDRYEVWLNGISVGTETKRDYVLTSPLSGPGEYRWHVQVVDHEGDVVGQPGPEWRFVILEPTLTSAPPVARPTAVPSSKLVLIAPVSGHTYPSPIKFEWQGELQPGQSYQVTVRHAPSNFVIQSGLLSTPSWESVLPDDKIGEWYWRVSVIQNGQATSSSPESLFWFNPLGLQDPHHEPKATPR